MIARLEHQRTGLAIVVGAAVLLAGCTGPAPAAAPAPAQQIGEPTAVATAAVANSQANPAARATPTANAAATASAASSGLAGRTTPVRRGAIAETTQFNGRVTGEEEVALAFSKRVTPVTIGVKVGDAFSRNQILVEADNTELQRSLKTAQDQVQTTILRLDQLRRLSSTSQRDAVAAAEQNVQQAMADLAKLQVGASDADKQAADAAVVNAKAALDRAQFDLGKLQAPPSAGQVADAQQVVAAATLALRQAEADAAKVNKGPDPVELRTAEKQVIDAQAAVTTAQADLDKLLNGPSAFDLRVAQREVDRAQASLNAARSVEKAADRDAAVAQAKLGLDDARDKLARLKQPPSPDLVQTARAKLDSAKAELANAQDKLDALRRGPDKVTFDRTTAAVEAARVTLRNAQDKLDALQAGPADGDVRAAQNAVDGAQLAYSAALARRDQIYGGPPAVDLVQARNRVAAAQAVVDRLRQGTGDDPLLQRELQLEQDQVSQFQADIEATRLRAPFDGRVVAVQATQGEPVEVGAAALVVTKLGVPIVEITLPAANSRQAPPTDANQDVLTRLAAQQPATVQIDDGSGTQYTAAVTRIGNGLAPGSRTVLLNVDWGDRTPPYGATALVQITISQKQNVLLVPRAAIQVSGDRKFVEYLDPVAGTRKVTEVTTGASDGTQTEIVSGLSEGQLVLGGPAPQAPQTTGVQAGRTPTPRTVTSSTPGAAPPSIEAPALASEPSR